MAGYEDTKRMIIDTLMGRDPGTEIMPENHQAFALNMLDYIRSVEMSSASTLIGIAEGDTTPIQPDNARVAYIAGVAQERTVTFVNFHDINGQPISITTGEMEAVFVILLWNTAYWTYQVTNANIISAAENANFQYFLNIRKTYASVAAMNADADSHIADDGTPIRVGETVSVNNTSNPSENAVYSLRVTSNGVYYWQEQATLPALDVSGMFNQVNANVNYIECSQNAEDEIKIISDIYFSLSTHMRLLVKMTNANTHPTPKLNINNTGAKSIWYNGAVATDVNTWDAGEILDIYYNGTNYQSISIKDKLLYSLIESVNVGSQSSATNAFSFVPSNLRRIGLKVTWYDTVNTEWVTKQYVSSDLSGWNIESNWDSVDRFLSGQKLNTVKITNTVGEEVTGPSNVLSAEAGKQLNEVKLNKSESPECSGIEDVLAGVAQSTQPTDVILSAVQYDAVYISTEGVITQYETLGILNMLSVPVTEGDMIKITFELHKLGNGEVNNIRYGFTQNAPVVGNSVTGYGFFSYKGTKGIYNKTEIIESPITGYLNMSFVYASSTASYLRDVVFVKTVTPVKNIFVMPMPVGKLQDGGDALENTYISPSGVITSYSTSGLMRTDRIPVKANDRVVMECIIHHKSSTEFKTVRMAMFTSSPNVGDTCISGTLKFVAMPLEKGDIRVRKIIDVEISGYLAISYQYYTTSNTSTYLTDVKYTVINYSVRKGTMLSLGDSITYGYIPHGMDGNTAITANPVGQLSSYAKMAAAILNMNFTNYGISGNYLIGPQCLESAMCNRYVNMPDDADVVTFMGGTNDIRSSLMLGTMNDRVIAGDSSTYTYYAGVHKLAEGLYRKYILSSGKKIKLVGITPPKMINSPVSEANGVGSIYTGMDEWVDAFMEVCGYYGIPVCDFYHSGLLATHLAGNWHNSASGYKGYYNPLIPDGVHPNEIGHQYLGEFLAGFISAL